MKYILLLLTLFAFNFNNYAQDIALNSQKSDKELYYFSSDSTKSVNDTVKKRKGQELKEVIVNGNTHQKPVSALRSGLKPMDVPQSVQVISSEIIEQQQAIRLSDVIKNANGVYVGSARGGANESLWSRGYSMDANNMFKNGFRYNAGSIPDVASLERVEFLKGGSALLFGNVTPGGILNLVTKTPKFTEGGQLTMQMGSYAFYKPSIDFYGPINKSIAYRFNASYENSESFRDFVKNDRIYLNPSFLFKISDKTQITAQGDYLSADWIPDFGTGIVGKEILDIPRNVYYGALWSTGNTKSASASIFVNHDFNDNWKLGFNTSYQSYNRTQKSTAQLSNLAYTDNNGVQEVNWKRGLTQADAAEKIFADQLSLQGTFNTGSIKHQIFTGVDYEYSSAPSYTYVFYDSKFITQTTEADPINLFNYDYSTQSMDKPYPTRATTLATTDTQRFGAFAQDLISINQYIKILAGLRWSWQESDVTTAAEVLTPSADKKSNTITTPLEDAIPATGTRNFNRAFSPKAGLVIQPNKDLSLFASYSNSFTPNTGTTVDLQTLDPSIIDQYEAGIKKDFWKGLLSTNVTLYQIENNNLAQTAQFQADGITENVNNQLKELVGATKGKGIEIDITGRPLVGLDIIAGYSFNETKVSKSSGTNGSLVVGDVLARTPKHTANLSFFYKLPSGVLKGLSFGAIGNYIGDRTGGWNDDYLWTAVPPTPINPKPDPAYTVTIRDRDIPLEGYTTIDASVGYDWTKISILCKLSNITDELNYTVHENYSVNPIAPRQVMVSLKYKL